MLNYGFNVIIIVTDLDYFLWSMCEKSNRQVATIGLGLDEQVVDEPVPRDDHDRYIHACHIYLNLHVAYFI
jgi:5-formyltetrahydrofolate cyclo-ligase